MVNLNTEIETVVTDFTRNRRLFTAHDVTKVLRAKLTGERIRHSDVQKQVHALFHDDKMGIYTRTQVSLGANQDPFVYHLNHQDPNTEYESDWVAKSNGAISATSSNPSAHTFHAVGRPITAPTPANSTPYTGVFTTTGSVTSATSTVTTANDGFKSCLTTVEGRLQVPTSMIGYLDSKAYIRLGKVQKHGNTVDALIVSNDPVNSITSYSVNSDNRVRISKKYLSKIGGTGSYALKSTTDSIVIVAG